MPPRWRPSLSSRQVPRRVHTAPPWPAGAGPLTVQVREMRPAPAVERLAGRGIPLPQCVVGLAVQPADGPPLLEDFAQPVARDLPLGGVGGQILGLDGQRLLAGGLRGALLLALGLIRLSGLVGVLDDRGQPGGKGIEVTEHGAVGRVGERGRGRRAGDRQLNQVEGISTRFAWSRPRPRSPKPCRPHTCSVTSMPLPQG